jgi:hypothetical protein
MASAISLETARAKLATWMAAEEALATSQEYTIDVDGSRRTLVRADLAEVAKRIDYWASKVQQLEASASGRSRVRYVVN